MNEQNELIVLQYFLHTKTLVGGSGRLDKPPHEKVMFKLKDGEQVFEKEFSRFDLSEEIVRLEEAGKKVPDEFRDILTLLK